MFGNAQNTKTSARSFTNITCVTLCLTLVTATATRADVLDQVINRATQARDRAADAKESANEIRNRIREAANNLKGDVKDAITEAVQQVSEKISIQFAGKKEFESQHCEEFRAELIGLLQNLQSIDDRIRAMISPCLNQGGPEPLAPLISLLEQAPCGVLYPLYQVEIDFCPLNELNQTIDAMLIIENILGSLNGQGGHDGPVLDFVPPIDESNEVDVDAQVFGARLSASRIYLENYDILSRATGDIKRAAWVLKKVGSHFKSKGETHITEPSVGIHGYAHLKVSSNKRKQLGENIESKADLLKEIADYVEGKLKNAKELSTKNLYLTNQETIIANQEAILAALAE